VAVWAFNEKGGPVCSSGPNSQNYNMTTNGSPAWTGGKYGWGMQFTGSSSQYLSSAAISELASASRVTIFAVGNIASSTATWTCGSWLNDNNRFGISNQSGSCYFLISNGTSVYPSTPNLPASPFSVGMAYDGTQATATNRLVVCINGVKQTITSGGTIPTTLSSTAYPFYIGYDMTDSIYQTGETELVALWAGRTLTAGELTILHENPCSLWSPVPGNWLWRGAAGASIYPPSPYLVFPSMYFPSMIEE